MKVNTILFDLDGTLVDSNEIIVRTFEHVMTKYVPEVELNIELIKSFIGPSLYQTFGEYRTIEIVEEMILEFRDYYKENEHQYFSIYPNVIDVLKELKKRGIKMGIVTTKFMDAAWPSIKHFELEAYFDTYIGLEHVENPKPDPEPIYKALENIKDYTGVMMVGDNKSDIKAGQNANCLSVGVGWTFKGREELNKANPDYMLDSMFDLLDIIDELNS